MVEAGQPVSSLLERRRALDGDWPHDVGRRSGRRERRERDGRREQRATRCVQFWLHLDGADVQCPLGGTEQLPLPSGRVGGTVRVRDATMRAAALRVAALRAAAPRAAETCEPAHRRGWQPPRTAGGYVLGGAGHVQLAHRGFLVVELGAVGSLRGVLRGALRGAECLNARLELREVDARRQPAERPSQRRGARLAAAARARAGAALHQA